MRQLRALLLFLVLASCSYAGVINGDLESTSETPLPLLFDTLLTGSTAIPGWEVIGASVDWISPTYWQTDTGLRNVDLSGDAPGGIRQTFSTIAGQRYSVVFWMAGNPDDWMSSTWSGQAMPKTLKVSATGDPGQEFTVLPNTRADMNWQQFSYSFTASQTSTTLQFESLTAGPYGPVLDDVSVAEAPEPGVFALIGAGLTLILIRYRTARQRS
jgi:choice-of-anchor C domain-containing protein